MLATYAGMGAAQVRSYASGALDPQLERYATHTALASIKVRVFWHQQTNTVMKGQPAHSAVVHTIDTTGELQRATITDCVDSTGYDEIDKSSGQSVPVSSGRSRHVVTSTAQRTPTGTWLVHSSKIDRDRSC
ncbi:hypothetical protein ACIF8W_28250 [Streptomyces sp. NPDC085639]|uniref:hypothetical protein n=1 Tax=Streptomyces sp. NPDC085639 TaxID=3365734 RepID=UPI0037D0B63E